MHKFYLKEIYYMVRKSILKRRKRMGRDITRLHPELQQIVKVLLQKCQEKGLKVRITETYRTKAEQDALYALGRTMPGKIVTNSRYPLSAHCWGVAFDFCRNERNKEYNDDDNFFAKVAAIAKPLGLTWGGDWNGFVDKPHFEMTKFMPKSSTSKLISVYGTPDGFIKTWQTPQMPKPPQPQAPQKEEEEEMEKVYQTIKDIPDWAKPTIQKLIDKKYILGAAEGTIGLTETAVKVLVINDRAGLYS